MSEQEARSAAFDGDWTRLWFSLVGPWASLAVVPTDAGVDPTPIADGLASVGRRSGTRPVRVVNACAVRLEDVERVVQSVNAMTDAGDLVLVTVDSLAGNPAALPIIRATSGALLVARIPDSYLSSARHTVQAIGKNRIVGSVLLG